MTDTIFFFLIVMCGIMGVTLLIFVMYHFYLIGNGTTTNERVKKNDDIDYFSKQLKYAKKIKTKLNNEVREVDWKGQKVTLKDIEQYESVCQRKKAVAEKIVDKRGFWPKLMEVMKA